ncbi:MAG TPA: hypothetical protein V6C97_02160 [Oculatellaceae cyanobacterium]
MEIFEQMLFEEVLNSAVSRFSERIVQRCEGAERALVILKNDPESDGIWLSKFMENFLADSLLNSTAGAAFMLQALEKRKPSRQYDGTAGEIMQKMASDIFAQLVRQKTVERLEQSVAFGGVGQK